MVSVGFIGISHLSMNYAAAALEKGFKVICYDEDAEIVSLAENFSLDYSEPGLSDTLQKSRQNISFSTNANSLSDCDVLYISKDVPTDGYGNSDLSSIKALINIAIQAAKKEACLVILCQVPPGFTRAISYPKDLLFCHVETLVFGQALNRALNPERIIIGMVDPNSDLPTSLSNYLSSFSCPILKMKYESAELAKISINLFLVSSVVTTNMICELCENIGADWFEIQSALRLDKRIGEHAYLTPGLGIAGGNLERDLNTTAKLSYFYGVKNDIVASWQADCFYRRDWVLRVLFKQILPKMPSATIGILGVSYKENTSSIKNSPSVYLMKHLKGYKVKAFDPVVKKSPVDEIDVCDRLEEILDADIIIVMTPWEGFKNINLNKLSSSKILIDPFNCFRDKTKQIYADYYSIGRSSRHVT